MMANSKKIRAQIIEALSHPEAEEGLYLNNLMVVHEEEERPIVEGEQEDVLEVLREMISDNVVEIDDSGESVIFKLKAQK